MSIELGCIADDFTGATDLANELQQQGLRTILFIGTPKVDVPLDNVDAIVIALKSRTAPVKQAQEESVEALRWLQGAGVRRFYSKYCSTFDSNENGNIGPIADALLEALGDSFTIASPAFPRTGRTVYKGYLFVNDILLSESHMRHHPLTPMTDSHLVRLMERQTNGKVTSIPYEMIRLGDNAIRKAFEEAKQKGSRFAVVDAIEDDDLIRIGHAALDLPLTTGASGIAYGLARALLNTRKVKKAQSSLLPTIGGKAAVLAGSCSKVTLEQIEVMKASYPFFEIDVSGLAERKSIVPEILAWAKQYIDSTPVLIYSSTSSERLQIIHEKLGKENAGKLVESVFAEIAEQLVELDVRRLIIAGGETAGAVVKALQVSGLRIGQEIDPGVPWTVSIQERPLALALKSGNFGSEHFFQKALEMVP